MKTRELGFSLSSSGGEGRGEEAVQIQTLAVRWPTAAVDVRRLTSKNELTLCSSIRLSG
jgi:hypothetical protein